MTFYSQVDIFILGIRRSGNHAISNWLIPHYQGVVRYFNVFSFIEQLRPENNRVQGTTTEIYTNLQGKTFCLSSVTVNDTASNKLPNWAINHVKIPANANLFGCENLTPQHIYEVFDNWYDLKYKKIVEHNGMQITDRRIFIIILRNPFNNIASMMQKPILSPPNNIPISQLPATWIAYAKEYLGETSYLKNLGNFITLNYDLWFSDQNYRKSLSAKLNQPFTDAGLQKVTGQHGGGSSFDGVAFSDKAQQMKVLERWKFFQNDREYLSLLKNEELLALYKRIYGEPPFQI